MRRVFSPPALRQLALHHWPGNVRELFNVVQRAYTFSDGPQIPSSHVSFAVRAADAAPPASFQQARARAIQEFENAYIQELLYKHHGNITQAAREAQKDRRAFGRLVQTVRPVDGFLSAGAVPASRGGSEATRPPGLTRNRLPPNEKRAAPRACRAPRGRPETTQPRERPSRKCCNAKVESVRRGWSRACTSASRCFRERNLHSHGRSSGTASEIRARPTRPRDSRAGGSWRRSSIARPPRPAAALDWLESRGYLKRVPAVGSE